MNGIVAPAVVVGVGGATAAAWAGARRRHRRHPETLVERLRRRMETSGPDQGSPTIRPSSPEESGDDAA